ncbi:RluA family pseudouridine synthase [Cohnella faecalis]|uniref:Pseudouridine synthase n=1 Tax=Cohnella faecalis TaxID=2315694 RepID=A0A398CYL1_9BACL|nr:RluA family pseudouridine synthase [Cohnella faecalis]RIE04084.1 RluA family pseudouridine synthase [Cohnella faecalis]
MSERLREDWSRNERDSASSVGTESESGSYYAPIVHIVEAADAGRTVRDVIKNRMGISRRLMIKLRTAEEGLSVNGRRAWTKDRVTTGDRIELRMLEEQSETIFPQPMELDIVFEDDHLLVVNKPAGLIVHPTSGHYLNTLANGVVHHWNERGERIRFRPVHRLDEHTSGLVVIAKNQYANQQMASQMMQGGMEKRYRAYVYGKPPLTEGEVNEPIGRSSDDPHRRIVREDGAASLTFYRLANEYECGASAMDIRLGTGRTHQIRVHMLHIGCPLIGDGYYVDERLSYSPLSVKLADVIERQALHAVELAFDHPVSGERMRLTASLPEDLLRLEQELAANTRGEPS